MQPKENPISPVPLAARSSVGMDQKLDQLAARLREARKQRGLSQEEVAALIGTTSRSITRWENGECDPGFVAVTLLAGAYRVSLDWLAGLTAMRQALASGDVLLDEDVLDKVRGLADKKGRLRDLPAEMVRNPGIDYAFTIPQRPRVLPAEEAKKLDETVQQWIRQLSRGKRR